MFRLKTTPAVVSAMCLAALFLAVALANAAPTRALTTARVATFNSHGTAIHKTIAHLFKLSNHRRHGVRLHRQIVRADWRVIALNRHLTATSQELLSIPDVEAGDLQQMLDLTQRAMNLDRITLRLNRKALAPRGAYVTPKVVSVRAQVRAVHAMLHRKKNTPPPPPPPPPTPTPTPTPTVTPTPVPGQTVITGRTFTTYVVPTGTHDVVYENCFFTGGLPDSNGVLTLTNPSYNITFRNCTIDGGPVNGVTVVDVGGSIHDITFEGCHFLASKGMGLECLGRPRGASGGYHGINLINCTFEPQGWEAISFDDDGHGAAGDCLITGNLIKGAGTNWSNAHPWGQGIEVNGPKNMTVTHNTIYQCKREMLNLQWYGTSNCGWVISDNVFDNSTHAGSPQIIDGVNSIGAINVYGGAFARNIVTSAAPGSGASFSGCHNMDWRTTVWKDARGAAYATPWQCDDSSGNLL